jgi:hypothetical protein
MSKRGTPGKLNARTCRIIYRAIITGDTQSGAARLARVDPATLSGWKTKGLKHSQTCELEIHECLLNHTEEAAAHKFALNLKRAEAIAIGESIGNIRRIGKKEWTANAWWLERRHPVEWGKKEQVVHSGEVNSNTTIKIELTNVTPQQRLGMSRALAARAAFQQNLLTPVIDAEVITPQDTADSSPVS